MVVGHHVALLGDNHAATGTTGFLHAATRPIFGHHVNPDNGGVDFFYRELYGFLQAVAFNCQSTVCESDQHRGGNGRRDAFCSGSEMGTEKGFRLTCQGGSSNGWFVLAVLLAGRLKRQDNSSLKHSEREAEVPLKFSKDNDGKGKLHFVDTA